MSTPTEVINEPTVFVANANRVVFYHQFVSALFKHDTQDMEHMHAALGVAGEAGELADAIKKHVVYGKPLDRANIVEELGDLRFYMQQIMNMHGITEEEVLQGNATKLNKRYPSGGYSNEAAIARADKALEFSATVPFNPCNYNDWQRTSDSHVWVSAIANRYVFEDEANQFDETPYLTQAAAKAALDEYCKHL